MVERLKRVGMCNKRLLVNTNMARLKKMIDKLCLDIEDSDEVTQFREQAAIAIDQVLKNQ